MKSAINDEVPEGWSSAALGEICTHIADVDHKMPKAVKEGVKFLSAKDLLDDGTLNFAEDVKQISEADFERLARKIRPQRNDIIYSRIGTIGKARLVATDERFLISYSCCVIRTLIDPSYLRFYLDSGTVLEQAKREAQSIGVPDLGLKQISLFCTPIAPLAEQRRIVAKVEELLARVNLARERLAKVPTILKRFRQSILAAACSGQLTADWRGDHNSQESTSAMLKRLGISVSELRGDLEFFELPAQWRWVSVRTLMDRDEAFCYGVVQPGADDPRGVFLVRAGDLENGSVNTSQLRRIPRAIDDAYSRSRLRGGELLVTVVGAGIGESAIAPQDCAGFNIARAVAKIPIRQNSAAYVIRWFQSQTARSWMDNDAREVARPTLNLEQLQTLPVPLPPLAEQTEIVRRVEALFAFADKIEARVQAATARVAKITQAILAKAFRGELVPTEAELARRESRPYEPASTLLDRVRTARDAAESNGASQPREKRPARKAGKVRRPKKQRAKN